MKKNNWYVITGGPCAGKTTVIKQLKKKGFEIFPEAARMYIEQEIQKGRTLEEIRRDERAFQHALLEMKLKAEAQYDPAQVMFFDRGIPDSVAYYKAFNIAEDTELTSAMSQCTYKKIFLFELLPYKKDEGRNEDVITAQKIQQNLEKSYQDLSIPIIRVPVMSVEKRVEFVLKSIEK